MITLGELRRLTAHLPDETPVLVDGYEWGAQFLERAGVKIGRLARDRHDAPCAGEHSVFAGDTSGEQALLLGRDQ